MRRTCVVVSLVLLATAPVWAVGPPDATRTPDTLVRLTPDQAAAMEGRLDLVRKLGVPADAHGRHLYVARDFASDRAVPETATLAGLKAEPVLLASLPELSARNGARADYLAYAEELLSSGDLVPFGSDARLVWEGYVRQVGTAAIGVQDDQPAYGYGVTVAIIDSGVDPYHELFRHRLVPGYDFLTDEEGFASEWNGLDQSVVTILDQSVVTILDGSTTAVLNQSVVTILDGASASTLPLLTQDQVDDIAAAGAVLPPAFGHGTIVTSLVHRIAPDAFLMPLRAFDSYGIGHIDDVIEAIYYAVDHGADVINMSFSISEHSAELQAAIDYATSHDVLLVAAAGNEGDNVVLYPAGFSSVVGVGSMDPSLKVSTFSNWGNSLVSITGPGEYTVAAYPGDGWCVAAGTSFATPFVAGTLAMLVEQGVTSYPQALAALSNATHLRGRHNQQMGFGGLDAAAAWEAVQ